MSTQVYHDPNSMTVGEHLEEMRWTLIRSIATVALALALALCFHKPLMTWLLWPLKSLEDYQAQLILLGPVDGMMVTLKTCLWFSLAATSPVWLFFMLSFAAPAFEQDQKMIITPFLTLSLLFLVIGSAFGFYGVIPIANRFFLSFNSELGANLWTLGHYLDYTVILILANALAFELGAVMLLLVHFGWVKSEWLAAKRKMMIVVVLVLSAVLTPPDILTQLLMAIPLMLLYEGSILYGKWRCA